VIEREKGDRSFSELIEDILDERTRLADVHGEATLDPEVAATSPDEIGRLCLSVRPPTTTRAIHPPVDIPPTPALGL